jgi:hypothetical protein
MAAMAIRLGNPQPGHYIRKIEETAGSYVSLGGCYFERAMFAQITMALAESSVGNRSPYRSVGWQSGADALFDRCLRVGWSVLSQQFDRMFHLLAPAPGCEAVSVGFAAVSGSRSLTDVR